MRRFTKLFCELDRTTRTNEKVAALESYFREAPPVDAAWALQFLSGRIPPRVVSTRHLWNWAAAETNLPIWLMEECYDSVGDLGETLALIFPESGEGSVLPFSEMVQARLLPLGQLQELSKRELLVRTWRELNSSERLVWNKLITGEFRVGVSRTLVIRALANVAGVEAAVMSHRVLGQWQPTGDDFRRLLEGGLQNDSCAQPYPFFLASPVELKLKSGESLGEALGEVREWQFEWKWDGIRAQLIRRQNETCIWSRGEEMVTDTFPEITEAARHLPDGTVLDGEILAWEKEAPLPFAQLQRRLGRKKIAERIRKEFPVAFVAYDLLEIDGRDCRSRPLQERRAALEGLLHRTTAIAERNPGPTPEGGSFTPSLFEEYNTQTNLSRFPLRISPLVSAESWIRLAGIQSEARERGVEGLMIKRLSSMYGVGRQRGDWWKWKINPFLIDAVLIYAQRGHGRRASLYTDYTFGVWEKDELVPVAKAYSGLSDDEIKQVDAFVRHNTIEKHGPVRIVKPELVFELAFEGIQTSTRHRSGIAVRFPRMNRWRHDKQPAEADHLETLRALQRT